MLRSIAAWSVCAFHAAAFKVCVESIEYTPLTNLKALWIVLSLREYIEYRILSAISRAWL